MEVLTKKIETELIVKNSRFINELFICQSQTQVREILKSQKEKYQDARRKNTVSCTIFTAGIVLDFIIHGII